MIITTTPNIEGKSIRQYLGIVSSESIYGTNIIRDFAAGLKDLIGGRSNSYETILSKAKCKALEELKLQAEAMNANAIVGIDIRVNTIGDHNTMILVSCSGTAVRVE